MIKYYAQEHGHTWTHTDVAVFYINQGSGQMTPWWSLTASMVSSLMKVEKKTWNEIRGNAVQSESRPQTFSLLESEQWSLKLTHRLSPRSGCRVNLKRVKASEESQSDSEHVLQPVTVKTSSRGSVEKSDYAHKYTCIAEAVKPDLNRIHAGSRLQILCQSVVKHAIK